MYRYDESSSQLMSTRSYATLAEFTPRVEMKMPKRMLLPFAAGLALLPLGARLLGSSAGRGGEEKEWLNSVAESS
jgi:hypothetical protein